jgi:hypothetical protein
MKQQLSALARLNVSSPSPKPTNFPSKVHNHIAQLSHKYSRPDPQFTFPTSRSFSTSSVCHVSNRVQPSIRRPADFHTLLQSSATSNTLLLTLFKTSTCTSCGTVTPIIESIIQNRPVPSAGDKFGSIAFAELELDSPEQDTGGGSGWTNMYDIGIEYGVTSVPILMGFGGRRAERITDRVTDVNRLKDKEWLQNWIDEAMKKGDPHPSEGKGWFAKIFRGGS